MKVLFLKIPSMKYYKGAVQGEDMPTGLAEGTDIDYVFEKYNFDPVKAPNGQFCVGYFNIGDEQEMHIENIYDVDMEDDTAENVLVIWCAEYIDGRSTVIGWYGDASVGRYYDSIEFDEGFSQPYNIVDDAENCVLLPYDQRGNLKWNVPTAGGGNCSFGLSRANIWFASEPEAKSFVDKIVGQIRSYKGENWLYKYPAGEGEV
jgi:hypothetical protein